MEPLHHFGEVVTKHVNDRPDSIEIGTPAKGGAVKIYFNAKAPEEETNALIDAAFKARDRANLRQAERSGEKP